MRHVSNRFAIYPFMLMIAMLFGCQAENPVCTQNFCAVGEIFPRSELGDRKFTEVQGVNDAQLATLLGGTPPTPVFQVRKVSFKDDIQPILVERCAIPGCHAAPIAAGLDLSKYDTFKKGGNNGPVFVAGDGKGSLVVKRIDGGGMPPIPPPLDADQVQLFIDWIDEGAENN